MAFTEEELNIISANPLALDRFRDEKFRDNPNKEYIKKLLLALLDTAPAFQLRYRDDSISQSLFSILQTLSGPNKTSTDASTDPVAGILNLSRDLINHIVDNSPDRDIWAAVFRFIDDFLPSPSTLLPTPPTSRPAPSTPPHLFEYLPSTFDATPCKTGANRLPDDANAKSVEAELFHEINKCTFRGVGGFLEKFFPVNRWGKRNMKMFNGIMREYNKSGKRWKDFPKTTNEGPVWTWLCTLEQRYLQDAPNTLHTTKDAHQFSERKGQLDFFLQQADKKAIASQSKKFSYKDVLVVGEHKTTFVQGRFKSDFLQLTRYVRSIFTDQPLRRFVHAFSLCGSQMELWVYDRSGAYSSGLFDIHEEPQKFAGALVKYATMNREQAGLDMMISRPPSGPRTFEISPVGKTTKTTFTLGKAVVHQSAIVCRGTTCYTTEDGNVVKFSWAPVKRRREVDHLEQAAEKGVKGVAKLVAHREVTTIAELRKGLTFNDEDRYNFQNDDDSAPWASSSNLKRKSESSHQDPRSKKQKSDPRSKKQKSDPRSKKQKSDPRSKKQKSPSSDLWEDRRCSCLVIKPAGRIISNFESVKELLEALRDAIKAHRSLHQTGNILHRDISSNNIIITDPVKDEFHGMLIDLDMAKERDSEASGARQQTGTVRFMAIEVLQGVDHTYRHDLESFFYVLIWMCARQSWANGFGGKGETPVKTSKLCKWELGTFEDIAHVKEGYMHTKAFQKLLDEFPKALDPVQDLCWKIRDILFPYPPDHKMFVGTPKGDEDRLYMPIIEAYDAAIQSL